MGHCFSVEVVTPSLSPNELKQNIHYEKENLKKTKIPPIPPIPLELISKFQNLEISSKIDIKITLKIPHEWIHREITEKGIIYHDDINDWLSNLYCNKDWKKYLVYNDQIEHISDKHHTHHGHSKGILCWNDNHISWLIHSVPNFPEFFTGSSISKIRGSEKIYGQSFCYIKFMFTQQIMDDIMLHFNLIDPNIYIDSFGFQKKRYQKYSIKSLSISENISHIVKPFDCECDIYENGICPMINDGLYVETWIRGHIIPETDKVTHISFVKNGNLLYKKSQDHSKWAISKNSDYVFIGDLNRMTSQFKRGGGGFLIKNPDLHHHLNSLIYFD
jgi:deoxyribonuclease-2